MLQNFHLIAQLRGQRFFEALGGSIQRRMLRQLANAHGEFFVGSIAAVAGFVFGVAGASGHAHGHGGCQTQRDPSLFHIVVLLF